MGISVALALEAAVANGLVAVGVAEGPSVGGAGTVDVSLVHAIRVREILRLIKANKRTRLLICSISFAYLY